MRGSVKHGRYGEVSNGKVLQAVLESMFAEAYLPGHSEEEAEFDCFQRAKDLCELVDEIVQIYVVVKAWESVGGRRAYRAYTYVGPDGIRKSRESEWQKTKVEAAPQPHTRHGERIHTGSALFFLIRYRF
jgi:hypothetical protein